MDQRETSFLDTIIFFSNNNKIFKREGKRIFHYTLKERERFLLLVRREERGRKEEMIISSCGRVPSF